MDVKELNNSSAAALLLQGKQNVINSAAAGQGFAELLTVVETKIAPEAEISSEAKVSDTSKNEISHKIDAGRTEDKTAVKDVKEKDRPVSKDKATKPAKTKNKPAEKADSSASDKEVSAADPQAPKQEVAEVSKPADNAAQGVVADETGVSDVVDVPAGENAVAVEGFKLPLDFIASLGMVSVLDNKTGQSFQMSGAELVQKIASGEMSGATVMWMNGEHNQETLVVAGAEEALSELPLNGMELTSETEADLKAVQVKSEVETGKSVAQKQDDIPEELVNKLVDDWKTSASEIEEQSSKLAEMLGKGQKVKIEVTANEENFSYRSAKDIQVTVAPVEETALDSDASANLPSSGKTVQAQQNNTQVQMNLTPVAHAAQTAVSQPVEVAAKIVAAPVSEAGSVTLANAGSSGSEFVQQAKLEAANDDKTSFRDVYKGLSRETIDQIKVNITKSAVKGVDKIQIQLKPEDLGNVEVKLQIGKDGKLQAHIISSRPETMEVLQKEMANLEKAFNEAGFQTDENSLSFSFRESNQQANQGRDNEELRQFIGDVFEKETGQELVSGDDYLQNWNGKAGLNIRV